MTLPVSHICSFCEGDPVRMNECTMAFLLCKIFLTMPVAEEISVGEGCCLSAMLV